MNRSLLVAAILAIGLTACKKEDRVVTPTPAPAPSAPTPAPSATTPASPNESKPDEKK
jgi:hypothetical protein